LAVALVAVGLSLAFLHRRQPLQDWLFWRFAVVYALTLYFGLGCWSVGHLVLGWLVKGDPLPCRERLVVDFAVGVLLFALATVVVGLLHGIGSVYFWALPGVFVALGARPAIRDLRRIRQRLRHPTGKPVARNAWTPFLVGFGALGLLLIYLPLLTTSNVAFDSRWYHLGIAEHFTSSGRIAMFPEGWFLGTYPHLSSWLYTWALSLPILDLHARIELAAHQEFLLFLMTLAAVPLLVEKLLHGRRIRGAWVAVFLFPGIFLYDSNLNTAADHVLAFWAVPLALTTLRLARFISPRRAVLVAALAAGAAMTKAQASYLLMGATLVIGTAVTAHAVRKRAPLRRLLGILVGPGLGGFLVVSSAHWLTNLVWYHNPVYPFLGRIFPSQPWRPGLAGVTHDQGWMPEGSLAHRLLETAQAPFTFAYAPHDWHAFHRDIPVFGFLFTLSLLFLPFLRGTRRVWVLVGACLVGLLVWYWTFHQDRYLQALLPWMVAAVVAIFAQAWRAGLAARLGVAALVAFQLISSGDVPFFTSHAMAGDSAIRKAVQVLSSTFNREPRSARDVHSDLVDVSNVLPGDAKVLLHMEYIRLGIGHPVVMDNSRWVGAPTLGTFRGPASAWQHLHDMGVTDILFRSAVCPHDHEMDLESELATHLLTIRASQKIQYVNNWVLSTLDTTRPSQEEFTPVVYLGCGTRGRFPWHEINALHEKDDQASVADLPAVESSWFDGVDAAVTDERCPTTLPPGQFDNWVRATRWRRLTLWIRR
jgi:hypothetical protein